MIKGQTIGESVGQIARHGVCSGNKDQLVFMNKGQTIGESVVCPVNILFIRRSIRPSIITYPRLS